MLSLKRMPPAATLTAIIILAGLGFSLAANLPGHLSYDSVVQLLEGREGTYGNWHPPVMSWLLGAFDALLPGTGLFVLFNTLLLFGSLLSLLVLPDRLSWAGVVAALLCVVSPQFFLYPGIVWKDVLFAALAVAAFVCLTHAAARWHNVRLRFLLITGSFFLLSVAALARQNGAIIMPMAALGLGWVATRHISLRQGWLYGAGALMAAAVITLGAWAALNTRVHGDEGPLSQIRLLQTYDIIGAVKSEPHLDLEAIAPSDPVLARELRDDGVKFYTPERNDTLSNSKPLQAALDDADPDAITSQWEDLVLHHTWLYLKVRLEVFRWVFLTPNLAACVPYEIGVDGPQSLLRTLGIAERMDARDIALEQYGAALVGTPLLSHAAAALIVVLELIALLRRRRDGDIMMAAMLAAALGFTLSFFVISIACDYRYLYFLDVAALVALFYLAIGASPFGERLKPVPSLGADA